MNIKRFFGSLLTVLGIVGLIYAAVLFASLSGSNNHSVIVAVIYSALGLVFFVSGISLIRTVKDN
ncbi:MAG: hypothetical protein PHS59_02865 [Paludibacter sp.]|nr:hypothetical protein [Paludibacter sp.]